MKIRKYQVELDKNKHNKLIREKTYEYQTDKKCNRPDIVTDMLQKTIRLHKQAEEHLYLIALDAKCDVLGLFEISHGTATEAYGKPREILIRALLCGATNLILAHNHPSGDETPSIQDATTKNRIEEACALVGIGFLDFIILGEHYYSFQEHNRMSNTPQ